MTFMEANFPVSQSVFRGGEIVMQDTISKQLMDLGVVPSRFEDLFSGKRFVLNTANPQVILRPVSKEIGFEEKIYNALVALKIAVSKYAMHLSEDERYRIFEELDSVINSDDWHEGDELPKASSFEDFLKWMIYSRYFQWTSIGVSDDGSIMVAWKTERALLTANFTSPNNVRWVAHITSDAGESGHTVGRCPLRLFAEQATFFLKEALRHEGQQHPR